MSKPKDSKTVLPKKPEHARKRAELAGQMKSRANETRSRKGIPMTG